MHVFHSYNVQTVYTHEYTGICMYVRVHTCLDHVYSCVYTACTMSLCHEQEIQKETDRQDVSHAHLCAYLGSLAMRSRRRWSACWTSGRRRKGILPSKQQLSAASGGWIRMRFWFDSTRFVPLHHDSSKRYFKMRQKRTEKDSTKRK
jgi:hypothetical protein